MRVHQFQFSMIYENPLFYLQMNGCITTNGPHHDLFEPYYQQSSAKRNFYDRDHHRDSRNTDAKEKEKGSDKDRHYSDDFVS